MSNFEQKKKEKSASHGAQTGERFPYQSSGERTGLGRQMEERAEEA